MVNPQDECDEVTKRLAQYKQGVGRFSCGKNSAAVAAEEKAGGGTVQIVRRSISAFSSGLDEIGSIFRNEAEELSGRSR
jgi:hypothetical protein